MRWSGILTCKGKLMPFSLSLKGLPHIYEHWNTITQEPMPLKSNNGCCGFHNRFGMPYV